MSRPPGWRLPPVLVLTDRAQAAPRPLVEVVRAAVAGGARAVVLREKDLPRRRRVELAAALRPGLDVLVVASDPTIASDGVHLAATEAVPEPRPAVLGRSCHDEAEVARATAEGCTYVTVSPVFTSASKPGYGPPLGLDGLSRLAAGAGVPVYALGGITPRRAAACVAAGAHGVAVMGAVMRAGDPGAVVAELVAAVAGGAWHGGT